MNRIRNVPSISFLFVLSLIMMVRQLDTAGYFACIIEDTFTFSSWAWQFAEALREGIVYPRWISLSFWGFGSPVFILYSPLAFYLASLINMFTDSIIGAMNIVKFMAFFLSGLGMYFLVKEFYSAKVSLLSASFYIVFPYNILEFYYIGSFASLVSLIWFSPLLLFVSRFIKYGKYKDIIFAGACYGGLILTHLINAYMFTFVVVSFVIYMAIIHTRPKDLMSIPLVIIAGILISCAYVLPLAFEKSFINLDAFITEGSGFRFSDFFVLPNMAYRLPADHFWPSYYNTIMFYLLIFCILILFFLFQTGRLSHNKTMRPAYVAHRFFLGAATVSLMLLFGFSAFIWRAIPFFKYIQFPVRWLIISVFAIAFLSASGFWAAEYAYRKKGNYFFIFLIFLVCLLLDFRLIKNGPMFAENRLLPVKSVDWTEEHLPARVAAGTFKSDRDSGARVVIIRGRGHTEISTWKSTGRTIRISARERLTLRIRTFNFPGWTAYLDGARTEIRTEDGTGAILIDIPPGMHMLELKFVDTPVRFYSKIVSLISFLAFAYLIIFLRKGGNVE